MLLHNKTFKNPYDNGFINIFYAVRPFGPTAKQEIVSKRARGVGLISHWFTSSQTCDRVLLLNFTMTITRIYIVYICPPIE